ncbi:MAG: hypothetical protein WBR17_40100 [Paraburkholderia sp.]|uniref:hypothetical protein n=1 Tax=Paraburkholderia sp. TaxID=1926495 RepID=UPI003C5D4DC8
MENNDSRMPEARATRATPTPQGTKDRAYDARLRCHWLCVTALSAQALRIEVVNGDHCDHTGAVEFAKAVMPGVRELVICDPSKHCTTLRVRDSDWSAT